jgi:hypothetical protein
MLAQFTAERLSQLRNANYMSTLPRNLFLACSAIVLAGCQHPLASSVAGQQPAIEKYAYVDAGGPGRVEKATQSESPAVTDQPGVPAVDTTASSKPQSEPMIASVQKQPESQTLQLADGLMLVFKTFTGR